jgi:hypothetical protein
MNKLLPESSTNGSPSAIFTSNTSASAVDTTARRRLSQSPSPIAARLSSDEPAMDPLLLEKYKKAQRLLDSNPEAARDFFLDLISDLSKAEANLLFLADCKIGLALTYPKGTNDRIQIGLDAKKDLSQVYKKQSALETLEEEMIKECQREIAHLRDSVPTNGPKVTTEVTKDPVNYWQIARFFIAFGFATATIASAFALLDRCYITQLNLSK